MSEIVVGYDGSNCGNAALDKACELAKDLGDRVVVVYGYAPGGPGGGEVPSHRDAVRELGEKTTAAGEKRAAAAGVEHEVKLMPTDPAEALMQVAAEGDARMIVVGTYGETPLRGMILGSTPYRLVHLADCPVLVVPANR